MKNTWINTVYQNIAWFFHSEIIPEESEDITLSPISKISEILLVWLLYPAKGVHTGYFVFLKSITPI